jgi:transposase
MLFVVSAMAENHIEQVNNRLDRVEEILVAHSERMDMMTQAITRLTHVVEQAHERQEWDLADHDRRLKRMEDVQQDTRAMLQIERCFNRLKQFRRIATRYEKNAQNYLAMLTIAAIMLWR